MFSGEAEYETELEAEDWSERRAPGAPYWILGVGLILVLISVSPNILVAELFRSNLVGMILLWAGSLLAFLVPFALFSEIDLKRQLDPSYGSLKSSVRRNARVFALLGFGFSLINVYFLADYLSRVLNVAS
jgi:hypothetical protein